MAGKSKNPRYPDADPTAPGGMSKKALREELHAKHNYFDAETEDMSWPELIQAVADGRKAREEEAKAAAKEAAENPPLFIGLPGVNDYLFSGHAGAGPSGSERWMTCTKSLGMSRRFLESLTRNQQEVYARSSTSARQGTTAHAAGEVELLHTLGRITREERDSALLELSVMPADGEEYTPEMGEHLTLYTDLVEQYIEERGEENVLIESKVEAAVWLTGQRPEGEDVYGVKGSADATILPTKKHPTLVVIDLKYGDGIDVVAEENSQLRHYGLGSLALLTDDDGNLTSDVEQVEYVIVQPRAGGIKTWLESLDDLLSWRDDVLAPALTAALYDDEQSPATFAPTGTPEAGGKDPCQWCPAVGSCPALIAARVEQATELFTVVTETEYEEGPGAIPETGALDNDRLGRLLEQANGLVAIRDALKDEAQRRLHRGEDVPGFKLVAYTPPRSWAEDIDDILRELVPEAFVEKKITPKQAEALVTKAVKEGGTPKEAVADEVAAVLGGLVVNHDQRPIIAPREDRRKEWAGMAPESMFDEIGDNE